MTSVGDRTDRQGQARRRARDKWEWTRMLRTIDADGLSPLARHTLLTLADFASEDGGDCYPTLETLARVMGRSRAQAGRGVQELAEKGWIDRRRLVKGGKPRTLYLLTIPEHRLAHETATVSPTRRNQISDQTKRKTSDADASAGSGRDDVAEFDREYAEVVAALDGLRFEGGEDWLVVDMLDRREPVPKVIRTVRKRRERPLRAVG